MLVLLLLVAAFICFVLAAFGPAAGRNWVAIGLALVAAALFVERVGTLS